MTYADSHSHRSRRMLYRSREGWIFGVAKGLANYSELSPFWIRLGLLIAFVLSGFFPVVILYIIAAFFMKPEPVLEPESEADWEFYNSYANSPSLAVSRLKRKFDALDRRTQRMEAIITAREFDWERRLRTGQ